ncbi:MAG: alpha/beta hydrolase [Chloroflexota bacterium]
MKIQIESKFLDILHHVVSPQKPTLVFLHEGLGCIDMWRGFPERVANATGCNLLVFSRLGYGKSDPIELPRPVRYMHHEGLETLPKLLNELNIGRHILIGHSDGGSIALINGGGVQSDHLMGIVTLAAHVFNEPLTIKSIEAVKEVYKTTNLGARMGKYHNDPDHTFWGWNDIWLHPEFKHWNIEAFLPTIQVPTLVIQGLDDQYGTLAQVDAILKGIGALAEKQLIPECKHSPHLEQPDVTLELITGFVNRLLEQ